MSRSPMANAYWVEPGRIAAGEYPGAVCDEDARAKLSALLAAGVRTFVDLTEEGELRPYDGLLYEEAERAGVEVEWFRMPIRDVSVPTVEQMRRIQKLIADSIETGRPVYVHCWGGVGRTGTVVGCYLVESGLSGEQALARLNELWQTVEKRHRKPRTPETSEQEQFVLAWQPGGTADRLSRFRACLLGGAVGDALGAPVEFMSLGTIRSRYGPAGIADFAPAFGGIGAITDDTQMTLWTAEGLLRGEYALRSMDGGGSGDGSRGRLPHYVHHAYLRWLRTQGMTSRDDGFRLATQEEPRGWLMSVKALHSRRAPGNTCMSALISPGMGTIKEPKNDSKGCGGVMRVAPVGLYEPSPERAFDLACELAALTHGHATGYLASGCLAAIVAEIMRGRGLRKAVNCGMRILGTKLGHEETTACMERALSRVDSGVEPTPELIEQIGGGWIAEEALAVSVYCALAFPDDFRRPLLLAVNHSGDSDSTGAITGNIVGALLGVEAIPSRWLDRLELRDEIETIATDLHTRYRDDEEWWQKYPGF